MSLNEMESDTSNKINTVLNKAFEKHTENDWSGIAIVRHQPPPSLQLHISLSVE